MRGTDYEGPLQFRFRNDELGYAATTVHSFLPKLDKEAGRHRGKLHRIF